MGPCWRLCRACRDAAVQLAAQLLAVFCQLVQQRYERREGLPLDRAAYLLVQHLAQHRGEAARVREVVCQGLGLRRRVVGGASRLVGHSGFSFRVAAEACRLLVTIWSQRTISLYIALVRNRRWDERNDA